MGYINSHMSLSRSRCLSLFNFLRACVSMSDYIKLCKSTIFYIKMASCKSWLKKKKIENYVSIFSKFYFHER